MRIQRQLKKSVIAKMVQQNKDHSVNNLIVSIKIVVHKLDHHFIIFNGF